MLQFIVIDDRLHFPAYKIYSLKSPSLYDQIKAHVKTNSNALVQALQLLREVQYRVFSGTGSSPSSVMEGRLPFPQRQRKGGHYCQRRSWSSADRVHVCIDLGARCIDTNRLHSLFTFLSSTDWIRRRVYGPLRCSFVCWLVA